MQPAVGDVNEVLGHYHALSAIERKAILSAFKSGLDFWLWQHPKGSVSPMLTELCRNTNGMASGCRHPAGFVLFFGGFKNANFFYTFEGAKKSDFLLALNVRKNPFVKKSAQRIYKKKHKIISKNLI